MDPLADLFIETWLAAGLTPDAVRTLVDNVRARHPSPVTAEKFVEEFTRRYNTRHTKEGTAS